MNSKEHFNYIELSDEVKLERASTGRVQLRSYTNDLILYAPFDTNTNAKYAINDINSIVGDTVTIENFGVFGQHAWIHNAGYVKYNSINFSGITTEGSIKFRFRAGFNNAFGYQEFNSTPTISGDTYYKFKLYIEGFLVTGGDLSILGETGDSLSNLATKINTAITAFDAAASVVSSKLRITGTVYGDSILIAAPTSGNSLLTLLGGVGNSIIPNAPTTNTEFIRFGKVSGDSNRISLIHTTNSHIILAINNYKGDTVVYSDLGLWSNNFENWYAFELDWNKSIAQLFIDGNLFGIALTSNFTRNTTGSELKIKSTTGNSYRFDELIFYNVYKNTQTYTVETTSLGQYAIDNPYGDVHFGTGFKEGEVTDLNVLCHQNLRFVVKIGNSWYYYSAGAWRVSDGSYSQAVTPGILETQFPNLTFNEAAELIIRAYFPSDGTYQSYLDDIAIDIETGSAEPATITGTVSLQNTVDLTSVYYVVIGTNSSSLQVDVGSQASNRAAATMNEIKASIDAAAVPGLATVTDDSAYHLVLESTTLGDSGRVYISAGLTNDALSTIWGYAADSYGEEAVGDVVDYSELYRYVRGKLGEPQIPAEITDEQLSDALSDAVYHYNRWRNFNENIYFTNLSGTNQSGYDIPAIVGGAENIIEIILRPRFPFTYYAGRTDLMSNLYVTALFQRYTSGFTQMLSDYYLTITLESDINIILGNQVSWEINNGKLFIHPTPNDLAVGIRYKGAMSAAEIVTNYWIRRLVLAEAKIVLGNIRSTFKNGIPGGSEVLQLNGPELMAEGKEEKEAAINELKKMTEPTFLQFG